MPIEAHIYIIGALLTFGYLLYCLETDKSTYRAFMQDPIWTSQLAFVIMSALWPGLWLSYLVYKFSD